MRENGGGIGAANPELEKLQQAKQQAEQLYLAGQSQTKCLAPEQPNPKEVLLRRLDYFEDNLIRQLAAARKLRQTLNWAGTESIQIINEILNLENFSRNF